MDSNDWLDRPSRVSNFIQDVVPVTSHTEHIMIDLIQPDTPALWHTALSLVDEYVATLNIDLGFQNFAHEREALAVEYAPPRGCFLIARHGSTDAGCGAVRPLTSALCEMKRLYIVPAFRGRGLGRIIATALIDRARAGGYLVMRLDTLASMQTAQHLYQSLGFIRVPAYRHNPVPGASFWELSLNGKATCG